MPGPIAVTTPVAGFTVATRLLLLLQFPPLVPLLLKVVNEPEHNEAAPLTVPAFGSAVIVMLADELELPQVLLTV